MQSMLEAPLLIRDVNLMSPGFWNGWNYTSEELKKAYLKTDWTDPVNTALFLDHPQNPNNAAASWIGRISNVRQLNDGTIKGNVEVWDESTIYKLKVAKAQFGVSPRVIGLDDNFEDKQTQTVQNYAFNSWSVVSKPAQDTAYLHLAENLRFSGPIKLLSKDVITNLPEKEMPHSDTPHMMEEIIRKMQNKETLTDEDKQFILKHFDEMMNNMMEKMDMGMMEKQKMDMPKDKMEMPKNSYSTDKLKKIKKVKGGQRMMSEEKVENTETEFSNEEKTVELSDADVLNIMNEDLEGFNSYAKDVRASQPSISLKDLAKKYREHKERLGFVEELSDSEANIVLKKLLQRMELPGVSAPRTETITLNAVKEMASEVANLKKNIQELNSKKIPAPKSVKGTPIAPTQKNLVGSNASEGVQELAEVLRSRYLGY